MSNEAIEDFTDCNGADEVGRWTVLGRRGGVRLAFGNGNETRG